MVKSRLTIIFSLLLALILMGARCGQKPSGKTGEKSREVPLEAMTLEERVDEAMRKMIEEVGWSLDNYKFVNGIFGEKGRKGWTVSETPGGDVDRRKVMVVSLFDTPEQAREEVNKNCTGYQDPEKEISPLEIEGSKGCCALDRH